MSVDKKTTQKNSNGTAQFLNTLYSRNQAIFAAIPDIIAEVDENKVYTWMNKAGLEFFGVDSLGKEAAFFFVGEQDTYEKVKSLFNGDENIVYVESWQHRRDGEKRLLAWWCCVLKDDNGNVTGALSTARDITEQRHNEDALRRSRAFLQSVIDASSDVMMVIDRDYRIVLANRAAQKMAGGKDPVSAHLTCYQVTHHRDTPCEGEMELCPAKKVFETRTPVTVTHTHYNADGNEHVVEISAAPIINEMGEVIQVVESFRDVTERKRIESQLRQSVKMEAIGRLAGGIAHDFNNMLAIIQGYADLMLKSMDQDSRHYEDVQSIRAAAKRAATLTRQLLAFGRKQTIQPRVIDLNEIITDTDSMLRRIIGEDIELITILGENPWCVKVDPIQVAEQVIINLAANAREAMPDGGKLTIETSDVTLDADYARRHAEVTPGDYVMLTVSDTGVGMTEEIKSHIFEPFFTTRETGKGTGLGLSTVYGVVKQSGGYIWVYSEPGKGTTFKIYLPRVVTPVERMKHEYEPENVPRGNETIMVAEDESSVRKMTCRMLRDQGYIVLEASDGKEAIRAAEGFTGGEIHMLITDVIMPHMSGKDLVGRVKTIHPNIKVLFVSGYTDNAIVHHGVLDEGVNFLVKPFSTRQLARTVHRLLNAK